MDYELQKVITNITWKQSAAGDDGVRDVSPADPDANSATVLNQVRNGTLNRTPNESDLENGEGVYHGSKTTITSKTEDDFGSRKPSVGGEDPIAGYSHQQLHKIDSKPALGKQVRS